MNKETFGAAVLAAELFLKAAADIGNILAENDGEWPITGLKETGALRRASMDLTRALSSLRRPS